MRTLWFIFFLAVIAIAAGFVLLGPDRMYNLFILTGRTVAPTIFVEDKTPKPEETLVAPFADGAGTKQNANAPLPVNDVPLDQPHRTADEVGSWVTTVVSSALSFDAADFNESQKKIEEFFTPEGLASYRSFIDSAGYRARIVNEGDSMGNFIQEDPFLLNKGAAGGTYHWLFEVPVMVSFLPGGRKDVRTETTRNEEILINVDVVRVPGSVGEAVRIYNWSARLKSSR